MNNLDIEETYRIYLEKNKALTIDENNDEILVGLSRSESIEYIKATNGSISTPLPGNFSDPARFLELSDRHQAARPYEISSFYLKNSRFIFS